MSTNGVRVTSVMGKLDRTAFKLLKYSNIAKLVEKTRKTDNPQKIQEADIVSPRTGTGEESQDGGQYMLSERRER